MQRFRLPLRVGLAAIVLALALVPILPAAALAPGNDAFLGTWARTDLPVAASITSRTWMWGPSAFTAAMWEPYQETPGGWRIVQYYDKSRMEITDPSGDANSDWYITNGLLARELVTGQMQVGDDSFTAEAPADVNVAGDLDDADGPTYQSFGGLLSAAPLAQDATVINRVDRQGNVSDDPSLAAYGVTAAEFVGETNHRVASIFWTFMNSQATVYEHGQYVDGTLFENPYFATGYPITEPYWARISVAGEPQEVLIQVFERRVLTYTPGNDPAWQVEAGNVGQHYYMWRYHTTIPADPPAITLNAYQWMPPAPIVQWQYAGGADAALRLGNQSPYTLKVQLDGPVSQSFTIDACQSCTVYTDPSQVGACQDDIPWIDTNLPSGNYRVQITYSGVNLRSGAGNWTIVSGASYLSCWTVLQGPVGSVPRGPDARQT